MEAALNNVHVQEQNEIRVKVDVKDALRRYCCGNNNPYKSFMLTGEELQTIKEEFIDEDDQLKSNNFFQLRMN